QQMPAAAREHLQFAARVQVLQARGPSPKAGPQAGTGAQAGWVAPVRGGSGEPVQCLSGSEGSDQAGGVLIPWFGDPAPCGTSHAIVIGIECELLRHDAPGSAGSAQRPPR